MSGWLDRLAHASDGVLFFSVALSIAALLVGLSGLLRSRRIEDVPTARVRSAPQGYVELAGTAHMLDGEPIIAPLSQTLCCWYRYRVERRSGKNWRVVESGTSDGIFVLRDATGDCLIDPEGAEVTSRHKNTWFGSGSGWGGYPAHARLPSLGKKADLVVGVGGKLLGGLGGGQHRYSEAVILDGDPLYAMGRFHTLGPAERDSSLRELTAAILRDWKRRPEALRARFDSNGDGEIDLHEWEQARAAANQQATAEQAESLGRDQVHTLGRPADGQYFLISNLEEFDLLRRYRWRKRLGFSGFLLLAGAVALMLSTRV